MAGPQRRLGDYVLLGALGRGGMGEVYLAKKGGLVGAERLCVIKTLRDDRATEPEYVRRFLDEARVVVSLQHAGICHVFDVGVEGGAYFLAMEHIPGLTLRVLFDGLVQRGEAMPPGIAVHVGIALLEALDSAHRHHHPITGAPLHIVHRDVSPQNIMVSFGGDVKLIDFGLAQSSLKVEQTGRDFVYGKLMYMSPEQARGEPLDGRSDQYSAAIVMMELLTGHRYWGDLEPVVIHRHLHEGGYRPAGVERVPHEVAAVLQRALHPDKAQRFETCAAMASALRALVGRVVPAVGGPDLRALMERVVPAQIALEQQRVTELLAADHSGEVPRFPPEPPSTPSSQPTGTIAVGRRQAPSRRPWLGVAAVLGGLLLGVGATIAVQSSSSPSSSSPPPPPPVPVAVVAPPPVVPVVEPAPPAVEPAVETVVPPAPPVEPAVEPAVEPVVEPVVEPAAKKPRTSTSPKHPKPPPPPPAPTTRATDAQKRGVMTWCTHKCVAGVRTQIAKHPDFSGPALDACYDACRGTR